MSTYSSVYSPSSAPADLEFIKYEKRGHIAIVTINRPEVRNALHTFAYQELRACWKDIAADPEIFVGIFTGTGNAFCAGRDIKFLAKYQAEGIRTPHEDPTSSSYHWGGGGQPQDVELNKPLICALNGFAVGVGLNMALQCQLRIMADDAWLGDQHTNVGRLGSPHEMYQAMPRTAAAYLTLCNGRLSAEDCLRLGIVNKVVPKEDVFSAAMEMAEMVCLNSPLAVQGAVNLFRLTASFPESLKAYAMSLDKKIAETDDMAEGALAFKEKRRPIWKMK